MYTVLPVSLRLGRSLERDANGDDIKWNHTVRDAEKLPQRSDALFAGVDAAPGTSVPKRSGSEEDVLRGSGAVLLPVAGDLLEGRLRAHNDGEARGLGEGAVGVDLGDLGEDGLVPDHNKVPRLGVHGGGGVHPGFDDLADVLVGNLFAGVELTDGTTGLDNVVNEFTHDGGCINV